MVGSRKTTDIEKKSLFLRYFRKIFFHTHGFPIFLICTVLAILFVLFRMKAVEIDYGILSLNKKIDKVKLDNKDLTAKKARLLSIKNLRSMAKKYELSQPKREQIIIIPK